MYKYIHKIILKAGVVFLGITGLAGCVDDDLQPCEGEYEAVDGFAFQFRIAPIEDDGYCSGDTDWEGYENYIDPTNLRVLIFDKDDKFIFEVEKKHIFQDNVNSDRAYYVKMSGADLNHYLTAVYDEESEDPAIRTPKPILDEKFKVAVLANWPKIVEGRRVTEDSNNPYTGGDPMVENIMIPYNGQFNIRDDIFKLSHLAFDNVYGISKKENGELTGEMATEMFDHLIEIQRNVGDYADNRGKMGVYSVWVHNFFQSNYEALDFIRSGEDGNGVKWHYDKCKEDANHDITSHYGYHRTARMGNYTTEYDIRDVWRDWNFTNGNKVKYNTENPKVSDYWSHQNRVLLNDKMPESGSFENLDGLSFIGSMILNKDGTIRISSSAPSTGFGTDYFKLRIKGEGTLHIISDNMPQVISTTPGDGKRTVLKPTEYDAVPNELTEVDGLFEYIFRFDPQTDEYLDARIYGDMNVYEIYSINSGDVYVTDRISEVPTTDYLIPMYGVQEFEPIRPFIEPNTLFSLSDINTNVCKNKEEYPYKKIYLLRSLAKIELLVSKEVHDYNPSHIALRSINRSARCEPLDVWTPTEILWEGLSYKGKTFDGVDEEIANIKKYSYFYDGESTGAIDYKKKQAWFYKAWEIDKNWDWNKSENSDNNQLVNYFDNDSEYPRILNARVDRGDFTHFNYTGQTSDGYYRYIAYMPEKYIDDPNMQGNLKTIPKVAHIEIRFEDLNDNVSLTSHGAYRIYFAKYNEEGDPFNGLDNRMNYDDYITAHPKETLGTLYPVIRNHIYRFTVQTLNSTDIKFQICTPASRIANDITFN